MTEEQRELEIIAQPGEDGVFLYKAKGQKTVLIDKFSPKTAEVQIGSRVKGVISREDERKIILTPTEVKPPVSIEISAIKDREGNLIGWAPDRRAVLFYTYSPKTPEIQEGDLIRGVVVRDEPTFLWLYPTEITPGKREIVVAPTRIHPFVPLVLNELVDVSRGVVRQDIFGIRTADQVLEDLVYAAFEFLGCGKVTQLGYRAAGQPVPDGDIFCPSRERAEYVLVYEAKSRMGVPGYMMPVADKRAFEDYLADKKFSIINERALVVISSSFADEPEQLRGGTLTFLPSKELASICAWKAMNPEFVNEKSLKELFFSGRILNEEIVRSWARSLRLRRIPI